MIAPGHGIVLRVSTTTGGIFLKSRSWVRYTAQTILRRLRNITLGDSGVPLSYYAPTLSEAFYDTGKGYELALFGQPSYF